MKSFQLFTNTKKKKLPKEFASDDVRNPESLVRYFLKEFTQEGDKVFDPFAGFGTTLIVAEEMKRVGFGVEYEATRARYIKSQIKNPEHLKHGDSRKLNTYKFPKMDFCFTSPPYMNKLDAFNPFTAYSKKGNYKEYLKDVSKIFSKVKTILKKGAYLVIEVSNLKKGNHVTTLAWDIAKELSTIFHFEGEVVLGWKGKDTYGNKGNYGYGYDHSYVLVFRND